MRIVIGRLDISGKLRRVVPVTRLLAEHVIGVAVGQPAGMRDADDAAHPVIGPCGNATDLVGRRARVAVDIVAGRLDPAVGVDLLRRQGLRAAIATAR